MPTVTVVATLAFTADAVARVKPELSRLAAATRHEAGCIEYRLHQDNDDPTVFIFYENWDSMASLDRHMNSDHYKRYVAAVGHLTTVRVVHKLTEVG